MATTAAPQLVVVPPTPIAFTPSSSSFSSSTGPPRPSPTSTATTSTAPATPRMSYIDHDSQPPRDSGESVFSIYDMYGRPGSWSASQALNNGGQAQQQSKPHRPHAHMSYTAPSSVPMSSTSSSSHRRPHLAMTTSSSDTHAPLYSLSRTPPPRLTNNNNHRLTYATTASSSTPRSSGLIYALDTDEQDLTEESYMTPRSGTSSTMYTALADSTQGHQGHQSMQSTQSMQSHFQNHAAQSHIRPPSSYRGSPAPMSDTNLHSPVLMQPPSRTHTPQLSNSFGRASPVLSTDPHGVPLPPSTRSSYVAPRSARNSALYAGSSTPPPPPAKDTHLSPDVHLSPVPGPSSPKSPLSKLGPNGSAQSLVPSEGETSDSFFVRQTYFQLSTTGVKGDGYLEGVERTRARIGSSRASEIMAEQALGDGAEKSRELSKEEEGVLRSLDRYGFFSVVSHDRLVSLPASAFAKAFGKMPAGVTDGPAQPGHLKGLPAARVNPKEESRISKWERMLEPRGRDKGGNTLGWTVRSRKERKLRERVYKGVPDRWRAAAWPLLMERLVGSGGRDVEGLKADFKRDAERPSEYDVQIDLDVPRTISGHVMFRTRYGLGQRSLFHVLHAFSLRCETCGYVQGMGPIAATLLCYSEPEAVYAALVRLHDAYKLHEIFAPGFPGLLESIYVQERLMEEYLPAVYQAFKKHMVSTTAYATKWYITLFANSVPFQTQLRLWDVFFLEGQDAFVVIALAVVWTFRDHITSSGATFETVLSLLSSFFVPEDEDALVLWIGGVLGNAKLRASMVQWRVDWKGLVKAGKDQDALL